MTHRLDDLLGAPQPWLIGIVNVTPDSFSDGGMFADARAAVEQARRLAADGAAVIDIGGESTAPGSTPLEGPEEWRRIEPVVTALASELVLSVDTYRASTAKLALQRGARIINDVSALRAEPDLARAVADHDAALVLMHAKDGPLPHATDRPAQYGDVVRDIGDFLEAAAERAARSGVGPERLVLDPGMGRFVSLDPGHSFELLARFEELVARFVPIPLMIACSRKGLLGGALRDRDPLSQLTATVAASKGARLVRTHDVNMARDFLTCWSRMRMPLASTRGPKT